MAIDRENNTRGYLLGRLFFMLEQSCIPKSDHTISASAFKVAMDRPSHIFPNMMKLKHLHIQIPEGRVEFFQHELDNILSELEGFPDHLTPQDQARFALGYHHQQQALKKIFPGQWWGRSGEGALP